MGVCEDIYKKCPKCGGTGHMQLRMDLLPFVVDLDDADELAKHLKPQQILDLHESVTNDGDPFVCETCGHEFHLDTERRLLVAKALFQNGELPESGGNEGVNLPSVVQFYDLYVEITDDGVTSHEGDLREARAWNGELRWTTACALGTVTKEVVSKLFTEGKRGKFRLRSSVDAYEVSE